jgi:N-ethylmaleimide reductase
MAARRTGRLCTPGCRFSFPEESVPSERRAVSLLSPAVMGPYTLPNRVLMAPMTRSRAGAGNVPTQLMAEYYEQRASAGLIITEATQVSPQGVGYPGTPGIHTAAQVEGWRRVVDAVHARGGRIFLQLWHVGRVSHPSMQPAGALPVAPSAIAPPGRHYTSAGPQPFVTPRALDREEIPGVVEQFAQAAERARAAGFDGVELHGANGYLIDQFLCDGTNHRTDEYGGSVLNRIRFLRDLTAAVSDVWGSSRVGVRISPLSTELGMSDSDPEATFSAVARSMDDFGIAYLHVVESITEHPPRITPLIRKAFRGPLVVNGGYDGAAANRAIQRGEADLVSFATTFLANPDLPERLRLGAPLNEAVRATFYGGDQRGYTDYPRLSELPATVPEQVGQRPGVS